MTKNEIDFIMADKRHIFRDVSVINRFNTGRNHRLVRGTLNINFKSRTGPDDVQTPTSLFQTMIGSEKFRADLLPWKPQVTLTRTLKM
jgi:hypothetical protein